MGRGRAAAAQDAWGEGGSAVWVRSALDSAALHLAHGLRPMGICEHGAPYVRAQRSSVFTYSRTAHCLRAKKQLVTLSVQVL